MLRVASAHGDGAPFGARSEASEQSFDNFESVDLWLVGWLIACSTIRLGFQGLAWFCQGPECTLGRGHEPTVLQSVAERACKVVHSAL